jgi:hypothetical protein
MTQAYSGQTECVIWDRSIFLHAVLVWCRFDFYTIHAICCRKEKFQGGADEVASILTFSSICQRLRKLTLWVDDLLGYILGNISVFWSCFVRLLDDLFHHYFVWFLSRCHLRWVCIATAWLIGALKIVCVDGSCKVMYRCETEIWRFYHRARLELLAMLLLQVAWIFIKNSTVLCRREIDWRLNIFIH